MAFIFTNSLMLSMLFVCDNTAYLAVTSPETPESVPACPKKLPKVGLSKENCLEVLEQAHIFLIKICLSYLAAAQVT